MSLQNLLLLFLISIIGSKSVAEGGSESTKESDSVKIEESEDPKSLSTSDEAEPPAGSTSFSAAVNTIRKRGKIEVMFRNGESYFIPSGSKHNEIYDACEESEKSGKAIKVTANPKTRMIYSVGSTDSKDSKQK